MTTTAIGARLKAGVRFALFTVTPAAALVPAVICAAPQTAQAADMANGYSLDGVIEYERLWDGDSNDRLLFGDLTLGFRPLTSNFGFTLGYVGYESEESDGALFGAGTVDIGPGTLQFGVPRSAMDDIVDLPALGGSRAADRVAGPLTRGMVRERYLSTGDAPAGLRYDAIIGPAEVAGSVSQFDGDTTAADATLRYMIGGLTLTAGGERITADEGDGKTLLLGASYMTGKWESGFYHSQIEETDSDEIRAWTAYGLYRPTDRSRVSGTVIASDVDGDNRTSYGVSADYRLWQTGYVQAGAFDGDNRSMTYDLSLGWRF